MSQLLVEVPLWWFDSVVGRIQPVQFCDWYFEVHPSFRPLVRDQSFPDGLEHQQETYWTVLLLLALEQNGCEPRTARLVDRLWNVSVVLIKNAATFQIIEASGG